MLETLGHDDIQFAGEFDAKAKLASTETKNGQGYSELNKKSKSKYTLMSVALDGEKNHAPIDAQGAIAFVGVSVGSPDFEEEEFWELCRSIVEAGYNEIVFVVGGVLQRHNVFFAHAHKKAMKGEEVTAPLMDQYAAEKEKKKWGKALSAERNWIEKHKKYTNKLEKEYGKKVTIIPWEEILSGKHGDFQTHLGVISHEFANGKNGIKTYVGKAANGMYEIRAKQTGNMSILQKELYDSTCVELEPFFKNKNVDYFKEETAAFRMLKVEKYGERKLHYIYPHKTHEIGVFFLKAIRRALELVSDAQKKLMEFYTPVPRNRAKKDDTNQRLYGEMERLKQENEELASQLQSLSEQLASLEEEIFPKTETIQRLETQVETKQARLKRVKGLLHELESAFERLPSMSLASRYQIYKDYTEQLALLAAEEEQEQQESLDSLEEQLPIKPTSAPTSPSGEHLSRGSGSGPSSGSNSNNPTPRTNAPSTGTSPEDAQKLRTSKPVGKSPSSGSSALPLASSVVAPASAMFKSASQQPPSTYPTQGTQQQKQAPKQRGGGAGKKGGGSNPIKPQQGSNNQTRKNSREFGK